MSFKQMKEQYPIGTILKPKRNGFCCINEDLRYSAFKVAGYDEECGGLILQQIPQAQTCSTPQACFEIISYPEDAQ